MHLPLLGVGWPSVTGPFGNHATLGSKIVAHWKLNETSGQRNDSHTGSYHLTDYNTVTYATGVIGNAGTFTRANSEYLGDRTDAVFNPGAAFSITCWVRFTTLPSANMGILSKWVASPQLCYRLFTNTSNALVWSGSANGTAATNLTHTATLSTATWYFLYMYFGGSTMGLSIDNVAAETLSFSGYPYAGSDAFRLGRMAGTYLNGDLDSVSFWNSTLTDSERTDLYNSGAGLDY